MLPIFLDGENKLILTEWLHKNIQKIRQGFFQFIEKIKFPFILTHFFVAYSKNNIVLSVACVSPMPL